MQTIYKNKEKVKAIEWAENNLVGKSVYNDSLKAKIILTRQGIKHAISARVYPNKVLVIYDLPELLRKSVLFSVQEDKKGRTEIIKVMKLSAIWNSEGKTFIVHIVVRLMSSGHIYYDHNVIKEKNLG